MGWHELEVDTGRLHEFFEAGGAFIVQFLEYWSEAALAEVIVELCVCPYEFLLAAGLEGFGQYVVTVVIVHDHDVFTAAARRDGEASSLITKNLSGDLNCLVVDPMGSDVLRR